MDPHDDGRLEHCAGGLPRWRRASGWVDRVVEGKVLVAAAGGRSWDLVGLSSMLWIVADRPGSVDELAARISAADVGEPLEVTDIRATLTEMERLGLVEADSGTDTSASSELG